MTQLPVVMKLDNGDILLTDMIFTEEEQNYVTVCHPFKVDTNNTTLNLSHWIPFSDDEKYNISIAKIVNISSMSEIHKKIYGQIIMDIEFNKIKMLVAKMLKINCNLGPILDDTFNEFLYLTTKLGLRYGIKIPEYNDIKSFFYMFVYNTMAKETEYGLLSKQ